MQIRRSPECMKTSIGEVTKALDPHPTSVRPMSPTSIGTAT
jgi:hypothetical protein